MNPVFVVFIASSVVFGLGILFLKFVHLFSMIRYAQSIATDREVTGWGWVGIIYFLTCYEFSDDAEKQRLDELWERLYNEQQEKRRDEQ